MQRYACDRLQRPAEAGGGQTESGRRGQDIHFGRIDMMRKRGANAMQKRIARSEHADVAAAERNDGLHALFEWARPGASFAGHQFGGEVQMPLAPENELGRPDRVPRGLAEARNAIFADADDGQPAVP